MRWLSPILLTLIPLAASAAAPPNVLMVMTDDQGFGDLGEHGNPVVQTPNLDAFAKQSVWLKNFYVCPVCAPTRASLLTGQYNYRTGVVDTYLGRALMRPDVKTLPEYLVAAGYRTGLFGKWHLGDNYPLRPEDRGFQTTLWSQGGGLAQPSDASEVDPKSAYFNPILKRNGRAVKTKGYCTDVFTDEAMKFIAAKSEKPFFAYVAFNAPHAPYQVPDDFAQHYRKRDLTAAAFPKVGQPWATPKLNTTDIANAYGMIENIDANFGRLMKALDEAKVANNTLVIFLTDNGPGGARWNAGLRNRKGSVYEGGIRVPCYVRWPAKVKEGRAVDIPLAHIDVTPTLLELCGVEMDNAFDGRSFARPLKGAVDMWPFRTLFFQWHRGDEPVKYRAFAVRGQRYKLVQANGVGEGAKWKAKFELFDIQKDPFEEKDLAADKPEEVTALKGKYENWFADVTKKGFAPPRIVIGNEKENPVRLSRQDWRGEKAGWTPQSIGHWEVMIERAGRYEVTAHGRTEFSEYVVAVDYGASAIEFSGRFRSSGKEPPASHAETHLMNLEAGPARLRATITIGSEVRGADYAELKYLGPAGKK